MSEPPNVQPTGNSDTHGSSVADGTDWASRTKTPSSVLTQSGVRPPPPAEHPLSPSDHDRHDERDVPPAPHTNAFQFETTRDRTRKASNNTQSVRATRRRLHRWMRIGGCGGASARNSAKRSTPLLLHQRSQLRGARHPPGRGERLGDLLGREVPQRVFVHAGRVALQREDHHHVREVHGLAPGRGPHLDEEDVDQPQLALLDHQVGGLDVPVGETDVPHPPDELETLLDHVVGDVDVADLDGVVEELHHDHVLPLRRDLDDPVRLRGRETLVVHEAERVVLVLDEPADRSERRLVLERPVQDRPPELVPAVGADVVLRVQLGEQVPAVLVLGRGHGHPERRRASRALQPDRFDRDDVQAELVLHRADDRLAAASADVEVRGLPAPVRDGEDVVRREPSERRQPGGDAEDRAEAGAGRLVDREVHPGEPDDAEDDPDRPFRLEAMCAGTRSACT